MKKKTTILGIETSCDETAVSIIQENGSDKPSILSNVVSSQVEVHKEFGGVVPELAARSHIEKIDIAVHALKDMPSDETEGLLTNCFLKRNDPREVLICNSNDLIKDLKPNSIVGTSSFRREFQLKKIRSDLNYKLIRGNVDTRLNKLNEKLYDAVILSYAGIKSLKLDKKISQIFSTKEIIPSVGQGVVALQCRKNDSEIIELLEKINHKLTNTYVMAERQFLKILEGDCETAVGAIANIEGKNITLEAELFSIDGKQRFYHSASKDINFAFELGT